MKKLSSSGFTLVETLVAIAILTLSVTGAFTAAQHGISSATYSKDQVVAFYLAAEGVEQIRNIRDNNGIVHSGWLTGIAADPSDPCYFGKVCKVDPTNSDTSQLVTNCASGTCPVIKLDTINGFYGYTAGWADTMFKREVKLTSINSHEVSILVSVDWRNGLLTRRFEIRENIFDWQ